jgi:hypothetical protein
MPRLEVPLLGKTLWVTGDVLIRAELDLLLSDRNGVWKPCTFRVDSGTEMTSMPAALASQLDLPLPQNPVPGLALVAPGGGQPVEVRNGVIKARVPGLDANDYWFPCYFLGSPAVPGLPSQPGQGYPVNLLGLTGVIDKLHLGFDGKPSTAAPYGLLIVETP